ncbi:MAG: hypothetical protein QXD86_05870 [Candidatus Bathyarchaeia archaeon]
MSGWVYDSEVGDYVTVEEYQKKLIGKEKMKKVEDLADALADALTKKLKLTINLKSGEIKTEKVKG